MATQLILTVGTNALPVWVAWHHLKDRLEQPVKVRFVHTADTEPQKKVLEKYCTTLDSLDPIQTDSGDPGVVRNDVVSAICDDFPGGTLHVHYTGGTKAMGVETVSAIESVLNGEKYSLETSYLDPRGKDGPRIVDRRSGPVIVGRDSNDALVDDTRKGILVEPKNGEHNHIALIRIAELNDIAIGPCEYTDRNGGTDKCSTPDQPTQEKIKEGQRHVVNQFSSYIGPPRDRGRLLEYATYGSFQNALNDIGQSNADRNNYKIFRSVEGVRSGVRKKFELDVVAVLGHQVVVVSCDARDTDETSIKLKAMEVYHRAKQLGGDEARAVMLCNVEETSAEIIQEDLKDETGSPDLPLEVWGTDIWKNLKTEFTDYLTNGLRWE